MKNYCIIAVFLFLPFTVSAQENYRHQVDSLSKVIPSLKGEKKLDAHYQLMLSLYHNEDSMDSIQHYFGLFIKEAQLQKDLKTEGMIYINLLASYCNREQMKEAIKRTPPILDFLAKNELWDYYYQAYAIYLEACFFDKQYRKAIDESKELYELAKKQGNQNGISAAYYSMALVYNKTGRLDEAEEYFRKCIDLQQKVKESTPFLTQSYFYLFEILSDGKRIDEELLLIDDWKKAIKAYEARKSLDNPIAWGQVYNAYAQIYYEKDQLPIAEAYCDSAVAACGDPSNLANAAFLRAMILTKKKEYEPALKLLDEAYETFSGYGEWQITIEIMKARMKILLEQNNNSEAYSLFETILQRKDSLSSVEFHAQLDELRTQYDVDKYIAEKDNVRNLMYFALAGCLFLLIVLGVWIHYNRQITKKNKALAKQIKKLQVQQEKSHTEILDKISDKIADEVVDENDDLCPEKRKDQLCIAIRDMLLRDKKYRDPMITRDMLVEHLGTNKELFIDAFRYCFGMSFSEYLSFLRLKDGIKLLEDSDLTIEEISEKVGFGTVRTFQRQFQSKYNMSPKDYRKASKESLPK